MQPRSVLVIESHAFQRAVLVKALMSLQIETVIAVENAALATEWIRRAEFIDIIFFDVTDGLINNHEFLQVASELNNVRSLVVCSDLQSDLYRSVIQMKSFSGVPLLGVLEKPLQMERVSQVLSHFVELRYDLTQQVLAEPDLIPEDEVRHGLATGAFRAWFQPKFNLHNGQLVGAEVLVRWQHPTRGMLLPRHLLAAMLVYDLIDDMFKQLLDQGLRLLDGLREKGVALSLSFNLAPSQLIRNDLVEHIVECLGQYGFAGSVLMFEVTENSLLDLPGSARENLFRLHENGCGLSIDDFGAGLSSFKALAELPFDQLKLDGTFVQEMPASVSQVIVTSSLALAKMFGMQLIVEGISDQRILDSVVSLGCSFGQGFHLARPANGWDFASWVEQHFSTDIDR
ncbi:EAL domain-containing protein [Pseudomonas lactis]|uniref:EAL domain-containing response regulator n=1 Tax=Pseudomonas lactis TaxID=1615674 RepID=UPI0014738459|nr:EAL domain-containing response regulator [Pseudomonas lactis]NNA49660.1 EAL domain-containing protein [Pseudomonas lactis]